ncbi:MAG: four helix bundle suffix domain-containing protein, partial [Lentisphaeria bacterium]|nr:four helix bundle suffix domain-containing protein [Lentisphaeria bacterium]
ESLMQNSVHYRSLPLKSVIVANAVVLLINVISFWLKKLIVKKLEQFVDNGGFSEHLYHIRSEKRKSGKTAIRIDCFPFF